MNLLPKAEKDLTAPVPGPQWEGTEDPHPGSVWPFTGCFLSMNLLLGWSWGLLQGGKILVLQAQLCRTLEGTGYRKDPNPMFGSP